MSSRQEVQNLACQPDIANWQPLSNEDNLSWNTYVQIMLQSAQSIDLCATGEPQMMKPAYNTDIREKDAFQELFVPESYYPVGDVLVSHDLYANNMDLSPTVYKAPKRSVSCPMPAAPKPVTVLYTCNCKSNPNRIHRPRNAFILFRQNHHRTVGSSMKNLTNVEISKEVGRLWRTLCPQERGYWKKLADIEKYNHSIQYPNYKYEPRRSGKKGKCKACTRLAQVAEAGNLSESATAAAVAASATFGNDPLMRPLSNG